MFLTDQEKQALHEQLIGNEAESPIRTALAKLLASIPADKEGEIEFGAKVPERDYQEFRSYFPQYGAVKWFIGEALRSFNTRVRESDEVRFLVERSITDATSGKAG